MKNRGGVLALAAVIINLVVGVGTIVWIANTMDKKIITDREMPHAKNCALDYGIELRCEPDWLRSEDQSKPIRGVQ